MDGSRAARWSRPRLTRCGPHGTPTFVKDSRPCTWSLFAAPWRRLPWPKCKAIACTGPQSTATTPETIRDDARGTKMPITPESIVHLANVNEGLSEQDTGDDLFYFSN